MADESRVDAIIDDEGRLFGLVNIIDALVVLVLLAVLVAGVALVTGGGGGETTTRYATIDAGAQPSYIAGQISEGDTWDAGGDTVTVTDVYKYPVSGNENGDVQVLIRAQVNGSAITDDNGDTTGIQFDGEPLRYGRMLEMETEEYAIETEVTDVSADDSSLATETRQFVVQAEVDESTAQSIQEGDQYLVGGDPIVTIESVNVYTTGEEGTNRVVLGVSTEARSTDEAAFIGNSPLRTGVTVPVMTESTSIEGSVVRMGSLEEPGVPADRTISVEITDVAPTTADALSTGMTAGGERGAPMEIIFVSDEPAEELVRSGSSYTTVEHPRNRDVTLELAVSVREQEDGTLRFRGEPLRIGDKLKIDFEGVSVTGEVQTVGE